MGFVSFKLALAVLLVLVRDSNCRRHTIFWDPSIEPRLKDELKIEVCINDWMDILCPHKTSFNRSSLDIAGYYLELYNVTAEHYKQCVVTGHRRLLHCKDPRQETKLTTKFQVRSPSPIGFTFQPGQTYYYLSIPMHSKHQGCSSDTLRMAIEVKKKNDYGMKNSLNDAAVIPKRPYSNQDPRSYFRYHHHSKKVPKVKNSPSQPNQVSSSGKKKPGNSSLSTLHCHNHKSIFAITLLSLFLYFTTSNQLFV